MASRTNRSTSHRTAYSAGGVIYRIRSGRLETALIATDKGARWGLPKGHVQRGETAEAAAIREIAEETGLEGEVVRFMATIEYWFRAGPARVHKYVDLFLLKYVSGDPRPQEDEVDDVRWFPLDEAMALVSFERERDVLVRVQTLWNEQGLI